MKQDALTGAADRQPLVSVIMPAYNAEKYIGEAVASVCAQTYENWELLILDDGSADRTAEIAQAYAQRDARIRVLRNPQNMGVARTRNRGFDLAQENGSRCSTAMTGGVRRSWKNSLRSLCTAGQGCCIRLMRSLRIQSGRCVFTAFRSRWITAGYSAKMSSAALPCCFTGRCRNGFAFARTCSMRTMRCGWRSCAAGLCRRLY